MFSQAIVEEEECFTGSEIQEIELHISTLEQKDSLNVIEITELKSKLDRVLGLEEQTFQRPSSRDVYEDEVSEIAEPASTSAEDSGDTLSNSVTG